MDKHKGNHDNLKVLILLHLMIMIYSLSGVCCKLAADTVFLSRRFCLYYAIVIALLGFYAIGWQQIIKRLPLTTAYSNRAATIIWGIIWGIIWFNESITVGKMIGALMVIAGVVMFSQEDYKDPDTCQDSSEDNLNEKL